MDVEDEAQLLIESGMRLLDAVEAGDLEVVQALVSEEEPPMFFQDPESGWSALHFAALVESPALLEYLLENGAVWNLVDHLGNTAGDVALSLNNEECYNLIRDHGLRQEFILRALRSTSDPPNVMKTEDDTAAASLDAFLASKLTFRKDASGQEVCMVRVGEEEEAGVMMGWERPIMEETVKKLCNSINADEGLYILNVGFGLGIIDSLFQDLPKPPAMHVIIEAHPDVLAHMRETGWYEKRNVVILEGKWQNHLSGSLLMSCGGFDAIYTDTFSEEYDDLHKFFEHVPELLRGPSSHFSWFNGLGATNALFYDIYTRLAELHLNDMGLSVAWSDVQVPSAEDDLTWSGSRKYFTVPLYRLPLCTIGRSDDTD